MQPARAARPSPADRALIQLAARRRTARRGAIVYRASVIIEAIRSCLRALFGGARACPRGAGDEHGAGASDEAAEQDPSGGDPVLLECADTLDLHTFQPRDVPSVVEEFLDSASREGYQRVRIIHGKGKGVQREIVRSILKRRADVVSFSDAHDGSGWGATVVELQGARAGPRS